MEIPLGVSADSDRERESLTVQQTSFTKRRTLLIVDDEPAIRKLLTTILSPEYDVTAVDSADAAQRVFNNCQSVDIILTDQEMEPPSKRTGIQLLEWVRIHSPRTIRLLMTGYAELENTIDAINRGRVYHYLSKPFSGNDEVRHVLRNAAEKFELIHSRDQLLEQLQQANRDLELRVAQRTQELEKAYCELQQRAVEMERLALTDPLTKLFNRRLVEALALSELKRHARYQNSLALGIVDIDHFKEINRRYLFEGGDAALVGLAKLLTATMRETDSVGRIVHEKFLVIARETNAEGARTLAERVRTRVEGTPIDYQGQKVALTVSIGCAVVEGTTPASYSQMYEQAKAAATGGGQEPGAQPLRDPAHPGMSRGGGGGHGASHSASAAIQGHDWVGGGKWVWGGVGLPSLRLRHLVEGRRHVAFTSRGCSAARFCC